MINDMQIFKLQKLEETKTPSGQSKSEWIDTDTIKVAVYLINEMGVVGSVRYDQYDCAGMTFYTNFDRMTKYRIVGEETYIVNRAVKVGCTTHLLLKRVSI